MERDGAFAVPHLKTMRPVHAIAGLLLASLAVGLSVLAFGWPGSAPPDDPEEHLALLIENLGEYRPLEGRLVGFDHWAPCETPEVGPIQPDTLLPEDVLPRTVCSTLPEAGTAEFDALWELAPPSGAPEAVALLRLQAIWDLVWRTEGDSGRAVGKLERAVELRREEIGEETEDRLLGEVLSDLSAAYLARGEDEDSPLDIIRAMDAAQRALDRSPELPEALFNRALAFERFFQRESARQSWNDFLGIESGSLYAHEARERLVPLSEPTLYEAWHGGGREELERAAVAGDEDRVAALVERFAYFAREWVEEELLPAWGTAFSRADMEAGRQPLAVSRAVAEMLGERFGDWMIADSIRAIDGSAQTTRSALARGHEALGVGFAAHRRHDPTTATEAFVRGEEELGVSGSPQALWAVYYQLVALFYTNATEGYVAFRAFGDDIPPDRYPVIEGRGEWMLGLASATQGRRTAARDHYRAGIEIFDRLASPDAGTLRSYLAGTEDGRGTITWRYRLRALADLGRIGDPRRLYNLLHGVVGELEAEDATLAEQFAPSLLATADAWGQDGPRADARLSTARIYRTTGETDRAFDLLDEAHAIASRLPATSLRQRLMADLELARGETLAAAGRHPEATDSLGHALDRYLDAEHTILMPALLEARGTIHEETGDLVAATEDFAQAARLLEEQFTEAFRHHEALPVPEAEAMLDRLGHRLVELALRTGEPTSVEPLRILDRTRAPWQPSVGSLPQPAEDLSRLVPAGRLIVVTATAGDRVTLWLLSRARGLALAESSLDAPASHLVAAVIASVHSDDATETDFQRTTAPLYDALIRPALEHDPSATELVIVPDGPLWELPFLGLFDSESESYLTDQSPVSLATSVQAALTPPTDPTSPLPPLFAVAGDAFDRDAFADLDPLPRVAEETHRIRDPYREGLALSGRRATRERSLREIETLRPGIVHAAGHLVGGMARNPSLVLHAPEARGTEPRQHDLDLSLLRSPDPELLFISACRGGDVRTLSRILTSTGFPVGVGNLWDVDDEAAARTGIAFHPHYAETRNAGRSLRHAVSELRDPAAGTSQITRWAGWTIIHTNRDSASFSGTEP